MIRSYASAISVALSIILSAIIVLFQVSKKLHLHRLIRKKKVIEDNIPVAGHEMTVEAPTSSVVELDRCNNLLEPLLDS